MKTHTILEFLLKCNCDYFTNKKALPLPSLPKDQIQEFIKGLLPDTRLIVEPKIDGLLRFL